jgi:DNA invertase Pin-like site-specific DNA recombinase
VQYSLTDHAVALGWSRERVLVIDEDQAHTATTSAGRLGFQRLVAEVGLGHVGIIVGFQMSRLARSCSDWYQLIDTCALLGTLLADFDGVYDPATYNDRLLLGLKGTISEAELYLIKQRMHTAMLAKAQHGELGMLRPMGYVTRASGEIVKDPDEQARRVVDLLFGAIQRRGTIRGVLATCSARPEAASRIASGPTRGAALGSSQSQHVAAVFTNPAYAGAYVYGRRPTDPRKRRATRDRRGTRTVGRVSARSIGLHLVGTIRAEPAPAGTQRNARAASRGDDAPGGIVCCGRCGHRMRVLQRRLRAVRLSMKRSTTQVPVPVCRVAPVDVLSRPLVFAPSSPRRWS